MKKVALIGAGAIGGLVAGHLATVPGIEIVLCDVAPGRALGKVLDISHGLSAIKAPYVAPMIGTEDIIAIKNADVVVITAGLARLPHMTRNDLLQRNVAIFKEIAQDVKRYAPDSKVLIVTNPLDTMAWVFRKLTDWPKERIMGMAGNLDEARFRFNIAKVLNIPFDQIDTKVIGTHNDAMIPLISHTYVDGKPLIQCLTDTQIEQAIHETRNAGATIAALYQNQSANMGPALAIQDLVLAMLGNESKVFTVSAYYDDEAYIGASCEINESGIRKILPLSLSDGDQTAFMNALENLKSVNRMVQFDVLNVVAG